MGNVIATISASIFYGVSSACMTISSKRIYTVAKADLSPMNLLMNQCMLNVLICAIAILLKELLRFESNTVPRLHVILANFNVGVQIGLANLCTVIFSLFAVKHSSITMFLAIRRCNIVS